MAYSRAHIQYALSKLPQEARDLALSSSALEIVSRSLKNLGLTESEQIEADGEIFYSLVCLQTLDDALNNIAKLRNRDPKNLNDLKTTVKEKILDQYNLDVDGLARQNTKEITPLGRSEERRVGKECRSRGP